MVFYCHTLVGQHLCGENNRQLLIVAKPRLFFVVWFFTVNEALKVGTFGCSHRVASTILTDFLFIGCSKKGVKQ